MKPFYPLTVFEEYMLVDETVDHPMTFFLRVDLAGSVGVDALTVAFSDVVRRHPIFWSSVVRSKHPRHSWQVEAERLPTLETRRVKSLGGCDLQSHIDLDHEAGIRAQLNQAGPNAELWLQFHHSCSDGMGGLRFLEELLDAYRSRISGAPQSADDAAAVFPTERCAYENFSGGKKTKRLAFEVPRILAFMFRSLIELKAHRPHDGSEQRTACPSFVEARLPFTSAIRQQLKQTQPRATTVNDLLMRDVYLALGDWIRDQQPTPHRGWLRVSAAINMRDKAEQEVRCHNDVSMVFVDRRLPELNDPSALLRSISEEMTRIKTDRIGLTMLRGLGWARAVPGGIAVARKLRRMYATTVVSNLGNIFSQRGSAERVTIGDLTIRKFGFLVPIREGTTVSFGALTYANELTIGMQYDDGVLDKQEAERLLALVTARLAQTLGIDTDSEEIRRAA